SGGGGRGPAREKCGRAHRDRGAPAAHAGRARPHGLGGPRLLWRAGRRHAPHARVGRAHARAPQPLASIRLILSRSASDRPRAASACRTFELTEPPAYKGTASCRPMVFVFSSNGTLGPMVLALPPALASL